MNEKPRRQARDASVHLRVRKELKEIFDKKAAERGESLSRFLLLSAIEQFPAKDRPALLKLL